MKPACTLLSLTLLSSPFVVSAQENIEKTFTFGIVSNKAQSKIKKSTPFTQYVTNGLAGYGYTKGAVKVFKNYRQLAVALKNGTVQIATATPPFNAMTLEAESGSQAIAIRWKKGLQKYHTVFFTHKESGIESISDLRGKTLVLKSYIHQQLLLTRYYTA